MTKTEKINQLLKDSKLKITDSRRLILKLFMNCSYALSYNDIEKNVKKDLDKATVYRTLKTFEEKDIIHQVFDNSNQIKYALCKNCCSNHQDACNHAHFKCKICELTFCIEEVKIPKVDLPEGFTKTQSLMLIEGVCKSCQ